MGGGGVCFKGEGCITVDGGRWYIWLYGIRGGWVGAGMAMISTSRLVHLFLSEKEKSIRSAYFLWAKVLNRQTRKVALSN